MTVDSYLCPTCGSEVKVGSTCPACNSKRKPRKKRVRAAPKERKSWEQDSDYDGLDLSDEGFDYDQFVDREFGRKPHRRIGIKWYWWATALVLLVMFVWGLVARVF